MPGAHAVIIAGEELRVILDALADATQYRWQLAGSCPADCMGHGMVCDDCYEDQDAAESYEHVAGQLTRAVEGEPPPRREDTIKIRGELL